MDVWHPNQVLHQFVPIPLWRCQSHAQQLFHAVACLHEVRSHSSTDSRHCSPLSITNLISKIWVQGEPILGQGYDRGDKVSPGNGAMALPGHPQPLQLQRHRNGQPTIHSSSRIACSPHAESISGLVSMMLRCAIVKTVGLVNLKEMRKTDCFGDSTCPART